MLSLVIPVYRNEASLPEVLDALRTNGFSVVDQRTDGGWYAATLKQGEV